jgi:site-specific DNA-methyltransferase (cytosine-N4-specific)
VAEYYRDEQTLLLLGDAIDQMRTLPAGSVDCIVTSPPYYRLRDYGVTGQYGQEPTVIQYVDTMRHVFTEARRVLADTGTLWLNVGDSYVAKRLQQVPARVAIALQDDGWVLRSDIIWAKTSGVPSAVRDRLTGRHEHLYLLTKKPSGYHFDLDAIKVPTVTANGRPQRARAEALFAAAGLTDAHLAAMRACGMTDAGKARTVQTGTGRNRPEVQALADEAKAALGGYYRELLTGDRKNPGDVWTFDAQATSGTHTASYPVDLPARCITAGCPVDGTVLDPFSGTGTTGVAAHRLGRRYIGIDLNVGYHDTALSRLAQGTLALPAA